MYEVYAFAWYVGGISGVNHCDGSFSMVKVF